LDERTVAVNVHVKVRVGRQKELIDPAAYLQGHFDHHISIFEGQKRENWPDVCYHPLAKLSSTSAGSQGATFNDIAFETGFRSRQSNVRTSPNCIFPQYDEKLRRWDKGGFCMEETLTGGVCVGDANGDGLDDLYYPRLDGADILYVNRGDGSHTFQDATVEANLTKWAHMRSNGCQFVDIDNDGDNDIYVSTLGDSRFYLFVNDGNGRFHEDAVGRGLGNVVRGGSRMTAGFTIAVIDLDNDGDLDIITTEWMPWLDGEDLRSKSAEAFKERQPNSSWTNARLFENMGEVHNASLIGHFKDITVSAGIMPKFQLQQRRPDFTSYACKPVGPKTLQAVLTSLGVNRAEVHEKPDPELHQKYILAREILRRGTSKVHRMNFTQDKANHSQYFGVKIGRADIPPQTKTLYVTAISLHTTRDEDPSSPEDVEPVQIYVGGRSSSTPTAVEHEWKANSGETLALNVGGAYGGRTFFIGVRCNHPDVGCEFEFSVLTSKTEKLADEVCGDGTKKPVLQRDAGPFKVELVVPWMTSQRFVQYAIRRMNFLGYDLKAQRAVLRDLMRTSDKRDVERFDRISKTQVKLQRAVHESKKWVLTTEDGSSESPWLQALTGVNQGGISGSKRMNHATEFPLVGAFQFAAKFSDIDMDGVADLIISGDFGTSQMYWGNKKTENSSNSSFIPGFFNLVEDGFDNSMGATVGDWDMDGKQDVLFTSTSISDSDLKTLNAVASTAGLLLSFRGNHLYRYVGGRRFEDVTDVAGVRESGWGWGAFLFDFDNDGDLDALNGNGMDDPETTDDDWAVHQPMRLYVNQGREANFQFLEEAKTRHIASTAENRAAVAWDFDLDGDLDVFVVNHADIPHMYRNEGGNYYDWLRVKVLEYNLRESIGAKVWVHLGGDAESDTDKTRVLYREVGSSSAFLGQGENVVHFGLGKFEMQEVPKVEIQWLGDAEKTTLFHVPIRKLLVVKRKQDSTPYKVEHVRENAAGCPHHPAPFAMEVLKEPQFGKLRIGSILSPLHIVYESPSKLPYSNQPNSNFQDEITIQLKLNATKYNVEVKIMLDNSTERGPKGARGKMQPSVDQRLLPEGGNFRAPVDQLKDHYQRAINFFQKKILNVDSVLQIAQSKGLDDFTLLALLQGKYPYLKADGNE
jgi:hypothetical protein